MEWRTGEIRLFISHLSLQKALAAEVAENLVPSGVHGFVAHADIDGSEEWREEMLDALK
jgi:hypothetical protein